MSADVRERGRGGRGAFRLLLLIGFLPLILGGCGSPRCADEVVQHEPSPYGPGTAIVFVRTCGATTDVSTQVALVGQGDTASRERSVVFVADGGGAPAGPGGGPTVRVRWIGGDHVEIAHRPDARTSRKQTEHGPVRITYAALP